MKSKKLTKALFIIYLVALVWLILFKMELSFSDLPELRNINLIPFADSAVVNGTIDISEIVDNLLAFIPFGVFTGMLLEGKSLVKRIAPIFLTSFAFEAIQFIFAIGASDITDLVMNTVGGIIGIGIFAICSKIFKDSTHKILNIICLIGTIFFIVLIGVLILANL